MGSKLIGQRLTKTKHSAKASVAVLWKEQSFDHTRRAVFQRETEI